MLDLPAARQSKSLARSEEATAHVERVLAIADRHASAPSDDEVTTSWQRSAKVHRVDPESGEAPRIVTSGELNVLREPLAKLIVDAREQLDHLYGIVQHAGYTVLLCNDQGVAVEHRGNEAEAEQFKYWGTWLGGVWAEEAEGTNGIGTCIFHEHPITVHRSQHFRARNTSLSCSGAPIFADNGKLAAVLDVSSIDPTLSEASHALTGILTELSARAIEERCFRERFRREWIVAIGARDGLRSGMLLAVDRDLQIAGADRHARAMFARTNHSIEEGISLGALFAPDRAVFRNKDRGDIATSLTVAETAEILPALITPPDTAPGARSSWEMARLHTRPRLPVADDRRPSVPPSVARGGLPPGALRRVKEYIDANLDMRVDIATLADSAGFSMFHFARAFKRSEGVTPHGYLLERRVERARKLLTSTNLSFSEIARASGFSDQGHLARHFRRRFGVSPSTFRWSCR
jgi:AraC-like DNA-binding protein